MRRLLLALAVILAAAGSAAAQSPPRRTAAPLVPVPELEPKPVPADLKRPAREHFLRGSIAADSGDLVAAITSYRRAWEMSGHPDASFNLGVLLVRTNDVRGAVGGFNGYLAGKPDAWDRPEVTEVINALKTTPAIVEVTSSTKDTLILVDGWEEGVAPISLMLTPGHHRIDAISPHGYEGGMVRAEWGQRVARKMQPHGDGGNVIVSLDLHGPDVVGLPDGDWISHLGKRLTLPAGKRTVSAKSRGDCQWDALLDVPAATTPRRVLYAYVVVSGPARPPSQCVQMTWRVTPLDL